MEVTKEMIAEWKKEGPVFKTKIDGNDYYFTTLDRVKYLDISTKGTANPDEFDFELETVVVCLLSDVSREFLKSRSGIVTILSDQIMLKSGFQQAEIEEL